MADNTPIEWADATVNYINGCSVISPGCTNCYAMRSGGRNLPGHPATGLTKASKAGHVWTGDVRANETFTRILDHPGMDSLDGRTRNEFRIGALIAEHVPASDSICSSVRGPPWVLENAGMSVWGLPWVIQTFQNSWSVGCFRLCRYLHT